MRDHPESAYNRAMTILTAHDADLYHVADEDRFEAILEEAEDEAYGYEPHEAGEPIAQIAAGMA